MSHLHNQGGVKWLTVKMSRVYLSLNSIREVRHSSPTPLFFHFTLISVYLCGANARYTHTELCSLGLRVEKILIPVTTLYPGMRPQRKVPQVPTPRSARLCPPEREPQVDFCWLLPPAALSPACMQRTTPRNNSCPGIISCFCSIPRPWLSPQSRTYRLAQPGLSPLFACFSAGEASMKWTAKLWVLQEVQELCNIAPVFYITNTYAHCSI